MVVDASGNVFTGGFFSGTVDFDPGPGVFNLTAAGTASAFICKWDATGGLVWAKTYGSNSTVAQGITIDNLGNVYATGGFIGTADFDPGPGVFNLVAATASEHDIYILKLDANGNFVWAKGVIGGTWWDNGHKLELDAAGNVYVVGRYYFQGGPRDFDPGPGTFFLTADWEDIFILKLDNNGNFVWARDMGNVQESRGYSIAIDAAGNVYTTGYFRGTVDFDPGAGSFTLASSGDWDTFYSKLDIDGNFVWAKAMVNTSPSYYSDGSYGRKIALDNAGNVYASGRYSGTTDFDPGAGTFNLTSNGGFDIYLTKLTSAGNFVWAKSMGGTGYDEGFGLSVTNAGEIYLTGFFVQTVDFDPGPGTLNLTASGSNDDVFISRFDTNGNLVWAKSFGGSADDQGAHIRSFGTSAVYVTGSFGGTVDFDPSACVLNQVSAGGDDIFIEKLNEVAGGGPLSITSLSSTNGAVGTPVTIIGTGFSPLPLTLTFNGVPAVLIDATPTSLMTIVPAGATTGPVAVTVSCTTFTYPVFFCVPATPASTIGLIASYTFSGNANDASINGNHGTVNGATLTTDRFGTANSAYLFNGSSQYISIPNSPSLQSATTSLTMNAWINLSGYTLVGQPGVAAILTKSNSSSSNFMYKMDVAQTPATIFASTNNFSNYATAPYSFCLNQWYMVTAVLDGTTAFFYVNGTLVGTQAFVTSITSDGLPLEIGRDSPGLVEFFNGKLDDIRIYNRALSPCEVAELYTPATLPPTITGFTPTAGPPGMPVSINGTGFDPTPGNNTVTFNGTAATALTSTPTTITTVVPTGATTGKIFVTVNCLSAQSVADFTVLPTPVITINPQPGNASICSGQNASFITGATGTTNITYQWQVDNTGFVNLLNDATYSGVTTATLTLTNPGVALSGQLYRCVINGDFAATVITTSAILAIYDTPTSPTLLAANLGCAPASTTITPSGAVTSELYRFYDAATGGTLLTTGLTYSTPALTSTTTYHVSTYNISTLCESTRIPVVMTVQTCNSPVMEPMATSAFLEGIVTIDLEPLISDLDDNLDVASLQIVSQPASGAMASLNIFILTIDYTGIPYPGTDEVEISVCDLTAKCIQQTLTVELAGDIKVFNALSPNGDGKNEVFEIQYIDVFPETKSNKVTIMNRWGNVVFEMENYNNANRAFSGLSSSGKELPPGTYYYRIDFPGGRASKTGYLSLRK